MTAPEGTLNLIVDMEVEDSRPCSYERAGNDSFRIPGLRAFKCTADGLAYLELLDATGAPIAHSDAEPVKRMTLIGVSHGLLRAHKPLVIK